MGLKRPESDGADADGETVERRCTAQRVDCKFACQVIHAHARRLAGYGQPDPISIVAPPMREADDTPHHGVGDFNRHSQRARLRLHTSEIPVRKTTRRGIVWMD